MNQFDKFVAVFDPRRRDDLVPGAADWIGRTVTWQAAWAIEEGPYEGEWACQPISTARTDELPPFAWAPSGDLRPATTQEER